MADRKVACCVSITDWYSLSVTAQLQLTSRWLTAIESALNEVPIVLLILRAGSRIRRADRRSIIPSTSSTQTAPCSIAVVTDCTHYSPTSGLAYTRMHSQHCQSMTVVLHHHCHTAELPIGQFAATHFSFHLHWLRPSTRDS